MEIPFWKMHGAANDFILVDDRERSFPAEDRSWIASIAARRTGVGSDGVILIQPSDQADFRMRFFNPDGGEAEMCGNGARCVARLASELGVAPSTMAIETVAGLLRAESRDGRVLLHMTEPENVRLNQSLTVNGRELNYHFANTGVPHVVLQVADARDAEIERLGPTLRDHETFAPAGTNVNVMSVRDRDALQVRTYERGVEAETFACGTGIVACGIIAGLLGLVTTPVRVKTRSGDEIVVNYLRTGERVKEVTMLGPAVHICRGSLNYPASD